MDFYRGHGKGGQHRNKRSTAVRVTHLPTGITVAIERGRSQAQNIDLARQELLTRLSARKTNSASATENAARTAQLAGTKPGTSRWT